MSQQYPRGYGYPNVQPINRGIYYSFLCYYFKYLLITLFDYFTKDFTSGYVDQAQYIPVQQQRPQVLQIALPPNMSPQNRPR